MKCCGSTRRIAVSVTIAILFVFLGLLPAAGQTESYLITASDSSLTVCDLATSSVTATMNAGSNPYSVAIGANQRLAFVGAAGYVSVVDLSIGREIKRIPGIYAQGASAFSSDGRLLLIEDAYTQTLDVIDTAGLQLVRRVKVAPALGYGASFMSSIVVAGRQAYVTTSTTDFFRPAIAVVDLATFTVKQVNIPKGHFDGLATTPNAAATPDGKYIVMVESGNSGSYHVLLISTVGNYVAHDFLVENKPMGIMVSPVNNPGSVYGYLLGIGSDSEFSATVLDLNSESPTFGELLPGTEVSLDSMFQASNGAAINADGSKLAVTGHKNDAGGPQPNAAVIDTALMLTDPEHAIVGTSTVAGGAVTQGLAIAAVVTTPPGSAPTVTAVSGDITNDQPNTIHVTGTNFASGALVRIASMAPLSTVVNSGTDLEVTVPQNAPAGTDLDVVVTNPGVSGPPAQQNQSGVLTGGLTIFVNPIFQPLYQLANLNNGDGSLSVFDFTEESMKNLAIAPPAVKSFGFNRDGAELYAATNGLKYNLGGPAAAAINPATGAVDAVVPTGTNLLPQFTSVAASINPVTQKPVVYEWTRSTSSGSTVALSEIDSDPTSLTYNTVLQTLNAGTPSTLGVYSGAATPDGKYVYVDYFDQIAFAYKLAIFDIVNGTTSTVATNSLGASLFQRQVYVTPDGQSLLLSGYGSDPVNKSAGAVRVLDIATDPKHPTLVATLFGTTPQHLGGAGRFNFVSYVVVNGHLFALDVNQDVIVAFNFDRSGSNYTQLSVYALQGNPLTNLYLVSQGVYGVPYLAASPDGDYLYLPIGGDDMITVLDANLLAGGQPPLVTNLGTGRNPVAVDVNPVQHLSKPGSTPLAIPTSKARLTGGRY